MAQTHKLFLFGLDNAGKTTLLKFMKDKEIIENPKPTTNFDIISMIIQELNFIIWDAPGQVSFRETWDTEIEKTKILLFILDTMDKKRFQEAKMELDKIINKDDTKGVPLIVCFHKNDLEDSQKNLKEAIETLKLSQIKNRDVYWLKTSVYTTESIEDLKFVIYNLLLIINARLNLNSVQNKF